MKLTFHGGANSVTGSNYLIETRDNLSSAEAAASKEKGGVKSKILVDCGLYQGSRYCEDLNFKPFPYDPQSIDAILITHAHIDHIGRLPQIFKEGFRGKIYSTPPTKDFAEELLFDSQHILSKEAEDRGHSPLYEISDVNEVLKLWQKISYHEPLPLDSLTAEFYDAGHILGSSFILVTCEGKKIVFSGDLGNLATPIVKDTEAIPEADYALIESTYGGRIHKNIDNRRNELEDIIEDTVRAGGTLLIPAFAMERTQDLLFELNELIENKRIPRIPVFIDSPLAIKLTSVYKKYSTSKTYVDDDAIRHLRNGDAIFDFPGLVLTLGTEQSKAINDIKPPKIIIAGSGMSHGGRILHHERRYLPDPKSTLLIIGYQAPGSLGRQIIDGVKAVNIFGEQIPVHCSVRSISGYSAHADQNKLLSWISGARETLKKVFVVQGEESQSRALAGKIQDAIAIETEVPKEGESVII